MAGCVNLFRWPMSKRELFLLITQVLVLILDIAIAILAFNSAAGMKSALHFVSLPSKLMFIMAMSILFIPLQITLIGLDLLMPRVWYNLHRDRTLRPMPTRPQASSNNRYRQASGYRPWVRVGISLLSCILYIAVSATSWYTCDDLCPAAGILSTLNYEDICCDCQTSSTIQCPTNGVYQYIWQFVEQRTGKYQATQGLALTTLAILLIGLGTWLSFKWEDASTAELLEWPGHQTLREVEEYRPNLVPVGGDIRMD